MVDIRLQRMAKVLVNYSIGVKPGERMAIRAPMIAAPLVREIYREAIRAGAFPETFMSVPGLAEILFKEGSDEQLKYIPNPQRAIFEEYETMISLWAETNTKSLNNADHSRVAVAQAASPDGHVYAAHDGRHLPLGGRALPNRRLRAGRRDVSGRVRGLLLSRLFPG